MSAPSNTFNYAGIALKESAEGNPMKPTLMIKYNDWETGDEIENEEDTGHVGGPSNIIAQDRSSAKAEPNFKDKLRYNEGLELLLYGLLGGDVRGTPVSGKNGLYEYTWSNRNTNELPLFTLLQGFNQWTQPLVDDQNNVLKQAVKPIIIDNQVINELEIDLNSDGDLSISPSFSGDYPRFNIPPADPTLNYKQKSSKIRASHISVFIGDPDLTLQELTQSDCTKEIKITLSNNLENSTCFGNDLGKNTVDKTNFTGDVELTLEMNRQNLLNKAKFATGSVDGTDISPESYVQQVYIVMNGPVILDGDLEPTQENYYLSIHLPTVNIDEYTPSTSGDDAATVEVKGSLVQDVLGGAPVEVKCITNIPTVTGLANIYGEAYSS